MAKVLWSVRSIDSVWDTGFSKPKRSPVKSAGNAANGLCVKWCSAIRGIGYPLAFLD